MILVDTSVWCEHLKNGVPELSALLEDGEVCTHELVLLELTCGTPSNRKTLFDDLNKLEVITPCPTRDVINFVNINKHYGTGCGAVDVALLASAFTHQVKLWTFDKRLNQLALSAGISHTG